MDRSEKKRRDSWASCRNTSFETWLKRLHRQFEPMPPATFDDGRVARPSLFAITPSPNNLRVSHQALLLPDTSLRIGRAAADLTGAEIG